MIIAASREPRAASREPRADGRGPGRLADQERWRTFTAHRRLLVATRTLTSAIRVLEALPALVDGDERVEVLFAHDPTSAFGNGVPELLRRRGCRTVPWERVGELAPDLVLTASENVEVPGDCPVLVIPHGVGFHKHVPDARGTGSRLSGLVPEHLLGRATMTVAHPDQQAQLAAADPRAGAGAVLVGDVCREQLLASLPQRAAYRRAMGVRPGQRLVVVSSTWASSSLLGRRPHLPTQVLGALPIDAYRVALVAHPNIWAFHSPEAIHRVLAPAIGAGLLLIPPDRGWQAAVVAADAVLGDHGSVTFYAATLDRPTAVATFGEDAVPGTTGAEFGSSAPHLAPHRPLREQVEELIASHKPGQCDDLAQRTFVGDAGAGCRDDHGGDRGDGLGAHGSDSARLRTLLYRLLDLDEPSEPVRIQAFPVPVLPRALRPSAAQAAWVSVRRVPDDATLVVERLPSQLAPVRDEEPDELYFLTCDSEEPDRATRLSASVVLVTSPEGTDAPSDAWASEPADAETLLSEVFDACPAARIAVVATEPGRFVAAVASGGLVQAESEPPTRDPLPVAAAVYALLRSGGRPAADLVADPKVDVDAEGQLALHIGPVRHLVTLRSADWRPQAPFSPPSRAVTATALGLPPSS
ncbi:hypothetical protein [Streptacidiphilus fuscans]|uniref:Uncharacterized protein n=1 Tax=Streptacidiphilus fuscans TaxID=2789292 RepID=A0A931B9K1_9ACTN|nr:hypothetical protein [Streptacidiphilus fuscans]MBF9073059.1 hypothetical protein [Streptacidiphilus fuscans]